MEAKTKIILLEYYRKMYKSMKNSVLKQRIGKLIRELESESKSDQKIMEREGADTCSTETSRQKTEGDRC